MIPTKEAFYSWIKEWKVAIFLFSNAVLFLAFFYSDISRKSDIGSREIIGDLSFKYNTTQRKFDKELVWDNLDANAPLSNRDTVRTETGAQAILRLKDGTEIQMDEDSMVLLEITPKLQRIKFEKGSINIKKNPVPDTEYSSISVESSTGTVQVNNGDVIVAKNTGDSLDVGVERGEAQVRFGNRSVSLKANQVLVEKEGDLVAKDSRVRLEDPILRAKKWERIKVSSIQKIEAPSPPTATTTAREVFSPTVKEKNPPTKESTKVSSTPSTNASSNTESKTSKVKTPDPEIKKKLEPTLEEKTDELRRKREQAEYERFLKM
jgi:hypothetical protein